MPTPEQIQAVVRSYVDGLESGDRAAWLACFAPDATQIDPYPTPANVGRDAIGKMFDNARNVVDSFSFDVKDVIVCGDRGVMTFTMTAGTAGGKMQLDGVDVF